MTLKRQNPPAASELLAALEHAWRLVAEHHPDLPPAQIVIAPGSGQRGGLLLGHLAPERWQPANNPGGALVHELLIAGEGLARGAVDVLTTILHEAAHALALTRGVQDTSRDGRYHNHRYQELAQELGLDVERDAHSGWDQTTLPAATRARYQPVIDELDHAITSHRLREPAPAPGRNLTAAVCACPRRIRVAPGTLNAGEITCQVCHQPFTTPHPPETNPESATAPDTQGRAAAARKPRRPTKPAGANQAAAAPVALIAARRPAWAGPEQITARLSSRNSGSRPGAGTARVRRNWPVAALPLKATPRSEQPISSSPRANGRTAKTTTPGGNTSMSTQSLNHVVLTGNLTADPELRSLPSGSSVCKLRVAVNTRRKDNSGEWVDKANYFDVTVWGAQGENAATYLSKGRPVGVQGRLEWREWETTDGAKRQAVEIIADHVQFLGSAPTTSHGVDVDPQPAATSDPEPAANAKKTSRRKREPVGVGASSDEEVPF